MVDLILSYKRGKFLENFVGKISDVHIKSDTCLGKAVLTKYLNYMSRRKYTMLCKIQNNSFTERNNESNIISYREHNILLKTSSISDRAIETFVNNLDIGYIHFIKGGVSRTVTALVTMIADLNLKVKTMKDKFRWFNGNINHFVVEFSDDSAPESKEETMTIATMSLWNYGSRIRSREFHFPLHMLTAGEKDDVCANLWRQHSEEMELIEGNLFYINNEKVTFSFVPAGDTSWLCWAANVLPTSATYPSPFCNLHKSEITFIDGSIGYSNSDKKWKISDNTCRKNDLTMLQQFQNGFSNELSENAKHLKSLDFMAENGLRQLGESRIGIFSDRIKPDPLHFEINKWTHCLNVLYFEATRRNRFVEFCKILKAPAKHSSDSIFGIGLSFIGKMYEEHYLVEDNQ